MSVEITDVTTFIVVYVVGIVGAALLIAGVAGQRARWAYWLRFYGFMLIVTAELQALVYEPTQAARRFIALAALLSAGGMIANTLTHRPPLGATAPTNQHTQEDK